MLALQTAGFNNPALRGPQIGLIGAPVWDRYVTGFISSLTPAAQVNPTATYYGPVYQFAGYGDMLREYVTPDFMRPFALLELLEQENGSHAASERRPLVCDQRSYGRRRDADFPRAGSLDMGSYGFDCWRS